MSRNRDIIVRQWSLVRILQGSPRGVGVQTLRRKLRIGRSTLYRDLETLRRAGVPVVSRRLNGEARYTLGMDGVSTLRPTTLEAQALRLARSMLGSLEGSQLISTLDALILRMAGSRAPRGRVVASRNTRPVHVPGIVAKIERAIESGRRLRLGYRGVNASRTTSRVVDPLALRFTNRHLYLVAFDIEKAAPRTFKVARVSEVELLSVRADDHDSVDLDELYARSVTGIWSGAPVSVAIALSPPADRLVREWPLTDDQHLIRTPEGIRVEAEVAGTEETVRWILGWGKLATPLRPPRLVEAVRVELEGALRRIGSPRRERRPTMGGTRRRDPDRP